MQSLFEILCPYIYERKERDSGCRSQIVMFFSENPDKAADHQSVPIIDVCSQHCQH